MKKNLNVFVTIFIFATPLFAQTKTTKNLPVDKETKLITYMQVVDVPDAAGMDLYNRALTWANVFYKNPSDVIRQKDTASATIICKHRFKVVNPVDKKSGVATDAGLVQYTLKLEFKEKKYRYTISDLNWKAVSYYPLEKWMDKTAQSYDPKFEYYLQQTDTEIKRIIKELDKGMKGGASQQKKDDW